MVTVVVDYLMAMTDGKRKRVKVLMLFVCLVAYFGLTTVLAQSGKDVRKFDIQGLKLNMNLDEVIRVFKINNVTVNKDSAGVVNGYEIRKKIPEKKIQLILYFTSEKHLYRVNYSKLFDEFRFRSKDLFIELTRKYGPPAIDNLGGNEGEIRDIRACWGDSCQRFPQLTPTLLATIRFSSGGVSLKLSDMSIFKKDWKIYKSKTLRSLDTADDSEYNSVPSGEGLDF